MGANTATGGAGTGVIARAGDRLAGPRAAQPMATPRIKATTVPIATQIIAVLRFPGVARGTGGRSVATVASLLGARLSAVPTTQPSSCGGAGAGAARGGRSRRAVTGRD